jgi:hypothetical protein
MSEPKGCGEGAVNRDEMGSVLLGLTLFLVITCNRSVRGRVGWLRLSGEVG